MKKSFNMPLTLVICLAAVFAGFSVTALADEPPRYKIDLEARAAEYTTLYGVGRGEAKIDVYGYIVPTDTGSTAPGNTDPPGSTDSGATTTASTSSTGITTSTNPTKSTEPAEPTEPNITTPASTGEIDSTQPTGGEDNSPSPTQPTGGGIPAPDFSGDDIYVDQPSVTTTSRIPLKNGWFAEDMGNNRYMIYDENGNQLGYVQLEDGENIENYDIVNNLIPLFDDNFTESRQPEKKPNPGTSAGTGDNIRLYIGMSALFVIFSVVTYKILKLKNNSPEQ